MKKIFLIGNEVWIEGGWTAAAYVNCSRDWQTGKVEFTVNFGSHGSASADEQEPYARAILRACEYARLCADIYGGKTKDEIRAEWDAELGRFYRTTYKEWNPKETRS